MSCTFTKHQHRHNLLDKSHCFEAWNPIEFISETQMILSLVSTVALQHSLESKMNVS